MVTSDRGGVITVHMCGGVIRQLAGGFHGDRGTNWSLRQLRGAGLNQDRGALTHVCFGTTLIRGCCAESSDCRELHISIMYTVWGIYHVHC